MLPELTHLPSRVGAFTAASHDSGQTSLPRAYVSALSTSEVDAAAVRVRTDGTNILIRTLQQSRAKTEAKKRAARAQQARDAEARANRDAEEGRAQRERVIATLAGRKTATTSTPSTNAAGPSTPSGNTKAAPTVQTRPNPFARKRESAAAESEGGVSGEVGQRVAKRGKTSSTGG